MRDSIKLALIAVSCIAAFVSAILCIFALVTGDLGFAYSAITWLVGGVLVLVVSVSIPREKEDA